MSPDAVPASRSVSGLADLDLSTGLTYFGNRLCPFAHRAWWAMNEKGVSSEARPSLRAMRAPFRAGRPD